MPHQLQSTFDCFFKINHFPFSPVLNSKSGRRLPVDQAAKQLNYYSTGCCFPQLSIKKPPRREVFAGATCNNNQLPSLIPGLSDTVCVYSPEVFNPFNALLF
jgi:hypothetical protein